MTDFNKLQAINAELMAYRNGWISYDRAHVRRLQEQRRRAECQHEHSVTTADGNSTYCQSCGETLG
jgi:hypothetical protein